MTFLNKQSFATFQVYFYSLIFERLSTQLNGDLYKKPLRYLVLGKHSTLISTFYVDTESAVLSNGFCTNYLCLSRGVKQGCLLSPCLFILAVELLACKIRQDKEIQGISIFGQELKLNQFADDTTLFNSNCILINKAIAVLDNFGDISGLKLNPSKTEALWLGPWRHRQDRPFGFQSPEKPISVLGTLSLIMRKKMKNTTLR